MNLSRPSTSIEKTIFVFLTGRKIIKRSFEERGWLKLDNAAKLFPAVMSKNLTSVFRITVSLKDPVKYSALKEAVSVTSNRFPYFSVSLGSGLFWHFLEFNDQMPAIKTDEGTPCKAFDVNRNSESLYRILVRANRISVEFLHILTDGSGALEYLKSLLYSYLTITGKSIIQTGDIILPGSQISDEEFEDGYNRYFNKLPPPAKLIKAWHLPFRLNDKPRVRIIRADISLAELLTTARKYKVTLTEYFVSVYVYALYRIYKAGPSKTRRKTRSALRVEVPVNMRNKLPSRTMRNFSLFVLPEIDLRLGSYTFKEILQSIHHQLQISTDLKQISRFLSSNVKYEKLFFVRILPLFIKKMGIAAVYRGLASKRWTGIITNLGQITLPEEMADLIDSFEIMPPPPNPKVKISCGLVSYNDRIRVCFSNITRSHELEKYIFRHLADEGIHIKILNQI